MKNFIVSPMPDPMLAPLKKEPGTFICGEHGSVPILRWALLSGRHTAEAVLKAK